MGKLRNFFIFFLVFALLTYMWPSTAFAANYGKTSIGGSTSTIGASEKRFTKFTSPSDISTVDSINVYMDRTATGGGYAIRGGIYTDNSGVPDSLVSNSQIDINSNIARNSPAWYSVNYSTKPTLSPSTVYWIGVQAAKASVTYYDAGSTNQTYTQADNYGDGSLDASWGAAGTGAAQEHSFYVTYTQYPDPTWNTGAADFEIWESGSTTWDAGTLVCSGTLTDDNGSTISCDSGTISPSTQYRVQAVLKNSGTGNADFQATDGYIEHKSVIAGWAGTSPTLGSCVVNDFGADDVSTTCTASTSGNDVRLALGSASFPATAAPGETEGVAYLITTDSDSSTSSTSYMYALTNALTGSRVEDSSKITITASAASPTFTQNDFEWFVTADSVTLSNIWPAGSGVDLTENAAMTQIPAPNDPLESGDRVRIQMNFTVGTSTLAATTQAFKLWYDAASDCTTASGWTAVGAKASGTIWRLFDESSIGDSTTQVNDISTSTASAEGYYSEINASGTNPNEVLVTENSEWDWPVENNGAAENTTYCFRMTKSDDTAFGTYNSDSYPKLTTAPGTANLLRHGNIFSDGTEKGFYWAN